AEEHRAAAHARLRPDHPRARAGPGAGRACRAARGFSLAPGPLEQVEQLLVVVGVGVVARAALAGVGVPVVDVVVLPAARVLIRPLLPAHPGCRVRARAADTEALIGWQLVAKRDPGLACGAGAGLRLSELAPLLLERDAGILDSLLDRRSVDVGD